jgi:hypothetical protein
MSRLHGWVPPCLLWLACVSACSKPADREALTTVDEPAAVAEPEPSPAPQPPSRPHTAEDRLALYEYLVAATLRRHAFSDLKTAKYELDFERDAAPLKEDFRSAATDLDLFRAIARLSALRQDYHMKVTPIPGGLAVDATEYSSGIEFAPDFEKLDEHVFCVQRVAYDVSTEPAPQIGDLLVTINGLSAADFDQQAGPYFLYSTTNGRAWAFARALGTQPAWWPTLPENHEFVYTLRNAEGVEYQVTLSGRKAEEVNWPQQPSRNFPGFDLSLSLPSFDLYRPAGGQNIVAFEWKDFEKEHLTDDLSQLTAYASGNDLLGHDVIVDFTRSSGGSDGVLALQVLVGKPFKTTYGDLRVSDILDPFIASREKSPRLRDWLHGDVRAAQARGDAYTAPVPFKLRHLPADSDGMIQPAPQHFTGRLVGLFGSAVGSQVDQVAALLIDNDACYSIGMPTGGYSNTWEWEEPVTFPTSGQPVAEFIWGMGRTYRPNGEELEANPPEPDELILLTSENVADYHDRLLQRAVEYLSANQ